MPAETPDSKRENFEGAEVSCWGRFFFPFFLVPGNFRRKSLTPGSSTPGTNTHTHTHTGTNSQARGWSAHSASTNPPFKFHMMLNCVSFCVGGGFPLVGPGMARCSHRFRQSLADSRQAAILNDSGINTRGAEKKYLSHPLSLLYTYTHLLSRQHLYPSRSFQCPSKSLSQCWDQPTTWYDTGGLLAPIYLCICAQVIERKNFLHSDVAACTHLPIPSTKTLFPRIICIYIYIFQCTNTISFLAYLYALLICIHTCTISWRTPSSFASHPGSGK